MKKNIMIIALSVVALLLAGTVGYLIADKVINNKYEDEVDTYKWTFKKQSDGKYYFYSGTWEN